MIVSIGAVLCLTRLICRELYHGGMEWHSDGALGEVTMLITFTGIKESMGPVRIMPGSHMDYVEGIGHAEVLFVFFIKLSCFYLPHFN